MPLMRYLHKASLTRIPDKQTRQPISKGKLVCTGYPFWGKLHQCIKGEIKLA